MSNRLSLVLISLSAFAVNATAQNPSQSTSTAVVGGIVVGQERVTVTGDSSRAPQQVRIAELFGPPAVRSGEYDAAPWLDMVGGPRTVGRILRTTALPGVAINPEDKTHFQFGEPLYVTGAPGTSTAAGQMFMSLALSDAVGVDAQVIMPTAVLRVEQTGAVGEAAVARIVKQYAPVRPSDVLVPYVPLGTQRTGMPAAVSNGPSGRVVWVSTGRVLPTLQTYIMVDRGSGDGVQLGDVFTLVRPREQLYDGTWLPEKEIARARAVRLSARGTTLLVIDQTEPAIKVGVTARVTARVP
jgi:hypothetical protein